MSADPLRPVAPDRPRTASLGSVATVVVVVVVTTAVLGVVVVWLASTFGVRSVAFAFLLNWSAMCWMGIVSRLVRPPLPDAFFQIRGFERSGRIYELAGVRIVKLAVRRGPLHWFNPHLRMPTERTSGQLRQLEQRMREPEAAHTWLFVAMLAVTVHALVRGWWWAAAWTMVFNVALNAYPVMLQRYNRRWLLDRIAR
jgi:ABC-type uncharacterized transport system permease subunit